METTDAELIERTLNEDVDAFEELVRRYQPRLTRSLRMSLGSQEDAEEITQEAFLLAYRRLSTFRQDAAFYSWLFRIARNAAISRGRKKRVSTSSLQAANDAAGFQPRDDNRASDPAHRMEQQDRVAAVHAALAELADEFREAIVLRELDGLSYEEIAEALDCPIGTVRSRIHRAREELRAILMRGEPG